MAASTLHYSTRLLVFKNWNYVGMYGTDGDPKIEVSGNVVIVSDETSTERTVLDNEDPPKKIFIQGTWRPLFK